MRYSIIAVLFLSSSLVCAAQDDSLSWKALEVFSQNVGVIYPELSGRQVFYNSFLYDPKENNVTLVRRDRWPSSVCIHEVKTNNRAKPCKIREKDFLKLLKEGPFPLLKPTYTLIIWKPFNYEDTTIVYLCLIKLRKASPSRRCFNLNNNMVDLFDIVVEYHKGHPKSIMSCEDYLNGQKQEMKEVKILFL